LLKPPAISAFNFLQARVKQVKRASAERFQEFCHFCLIVMPFFDQNQHPSLPALVLCNEYFVNNITLGMGKIDGVENGTGENKFETVWRGYGGGALLRALSYSSDECESTEAIPGGYSDRAG
jgi:hypothetical protein